MKIVSYAHKGDRRVGLIYKGNKLFDLSFGVKMYYADFFRREIAHPHNLTDLLKKGIITTEIIGNMLKWVEEHGMIDGFIVKDNPKILAPLIPGKIIAIGRNYAEHAKEQKAKVPKEPIFFEKANSSVIGPEENIVYWNFLKKMDPKNSRVDHEIELAIVIGAKAMKVSKASAMDFVFGYTILNDITARNIQDMDFKSVKPWYRSKSIDTFCPIGPCIVTKDEISDPYDLKLKLNVNGKTMQKDSTKNMLFKIPKLIEYITKYITLEPGDIISTGTPSGISPLNIGDVVDAQIEKIGRLRNKVVREKK
jgi:2-keto-4-pentenoate hydratase/2-oxohepta-3-ene-1,7-dioic acid hydratase in catechol pathway